MRKFLIIFCSCFFLCEGSARAEIHSYIDEKGVKVFVDGKERIPAPYQKTARPERNLPELQKVSAAGPIDAEGKSSGEPQEKGKPTLLSSAKAFFHKFRLQNNEKRSWKPTSAKAPDRVPGQIPRRKQCGR